MTTKGLRTRNRGGRIFGDGCFVQNAVTEDAVRLQVQSTEDEGDRARREGRGVRRVRTMRGDEQMRNWVWSAIFPADGIASGPALGAAGPGEMFILDRRFTDGGYVDVDALPVSERWVRRTVSAFVAEDVAEGERLLTAAEQIPCARKTPADALIWLDFVPDVELPDPPDVTTT